MQFDIIHLTEKELQSLTVAKMRLLRTAQRKRDEIKRKAAEDYKKFCKKAQGAGMKNSTLLADKKAALDAEVNYKSAILAEDLEYNMSVSSVSNTDADCPYLVDYSLSYNERYAIVRDYYLAITDRAERMRLYSADEVAKKYLGAYYEPLYNVLATYDK